MRAVVLCDEDAALEAIASGGGLGRKERETGYTALHYACQYGMAKLVAALLDQGAEIEAKTRDLILQNAVVQPGGQTPLHLAARGGEAEIVELLLSRAADTAARDFDGATPAAAALLQHQPAMAERIARAASMPLPSDDDLAAISRDLVQMRKARAAEQLSVPPNCREVYTLERVWSVEECERVRAAVDAAAAEQGGWTTERHAAYATTDLPCSAVPAVDGWVRSALRGRVLPRLAARHGWLPSGSLPQQRQQEPPRPPAESDGARLAFRDLFFVRYSAEPGCQDGLALHRDGSVISFNILLNDPSSFEGGGTYVEADDVTYRIGQGDCLVHSGKLRHGGGVVTRGERYVLVGFVDVLDEGEALDADEP